MRGIKEYGNETIFTRHKKVKENNMEKYVVFLRGINVGGNKIVDMNDLKNVLVKNQFENVKTYINSGNIVFQSKNDKNKIKEIITKSIKSRFKISVEMIIKTQKELDEIIIKNPFNNDKENDNLKRMVVMLSDKIDKNKVLQFRNDEKIVENYYFSDDVLYIYYHNGAGRSKFTNIYVEKKLNVISTARNWNTILKMKEMLRAE
jgi:uncharacterized protein (DUF1697 family)